MLLSHDRRSSGYAYRTGGAGLFLATAVILAALAFEHIGRYQACPLCLQQRYAYYAGVPLLFLALVLVTADYPRWAALLFSLVALAFFSNALLGVYHAGAEWKYWPGPEGCAGTGAPPVSVKDLLAGLETESGARCDEPQFRFLGLSFAGWNVVASTMLAGLALKATFQSAHVRET
jgi:disulfide bond formation protein DsbB